MGRRVQVFAFATWFVLALALTSTAQTAGAPQAGNEPAVTPLKVQVVLSKHRDGKLISSLPYTLSVAADSDKSSSLRMGAEVPVVVSTFTTPGKEEALPVQSFNYRLVGTNIDCIAHTNGDGTYRVEVTIEDSSVYPDDGSAPAGPGQRAHPSFRSFKANEMLILRDGQSVQFTTATDKVSGEVVKVDITLTVPK